MWYFGPDPDVYLAEDIMETINMYGFIPSMLLVFYSLGKLYGMLKRFSDNL